MKKNPNCKICITTCAAKHLYPEESRKLTLSFQILKNAATKSLLKKYLTDKLYNDLKKVKTPTGSSLLDCIRSGIENIDSIIGVYAPDPECYKTFAPLFQPIIEEYHDVAPNFVHPPDDWGDLAEIKNLDKKVVQSVRITCKRALSNFPFPSKMNEKQFMEMTNFLQTKLKEIKDNPNLAGQFLPIDAIEGEILTQLEEQNIMFHPMSRFLEASDCYNYWPVGRALFMNNPRTFFMCVNEEDHLKLIAYNKGPKYKDTYATLCSCINSLQKILPFVRDENFGYLTFNPANLGTTLKFEIVAKCPSLIESRHLLDNLLSRYNLEADVPDFPPDKIPKTATATIKNKSMMGLTEFEIAFCIQVAMMELAKNEKAEEKRLKKEKKRLAKLAKMKSKKPILEEETTGVIPEVPEMTD